MACLLFACTVLCFAISPIYSGSPCPTAPQLVPCICRKFSQNTALYCNYHDGNIITDAFSRISSAGSRFIDDVTVKSSRTTTIGNKYFKKIIVKTVSIEAKMLKSISDSAFEGQERSLSYLKINSSQLSEVPTKALNRLADLERLGIFKSEITEIKIAEFKNMLSKHVIREISLRCNYIKHVGATAFAELVNLRYLDLSYNLIRSMDAKILPSNNRMKGFAIAHNRLESVIGDLPEFPKGALVDLSSNSISGIDGSIANTMTLNHLSVSLMINPIRCVCSMAVLTKNDPFKYDIHGICAYPPALKGFSFYELTAQNFSFCFFNYAPKPEEIPPTFIL